MTALNLLREDRRHLDGLAGGSGRGAKPGRRPRVASNEEVRDALEQSLIVFAKQIREGKEREAEEQQRPRGSDGGE